MIWRMHRSICPSSSTCSYSFFSNDTAPTEIYTLSLHDALPICRGCALRLHQPHHPLPMNTPLTPGVVKIGRHTSELQSLRHLVCRLLLEKKKKKMITEIYSRPCLTAEDMTLNLHHS